MPENTEVFSACLPSANLSQTVASFILIPLSCMLYQLYGDEIPALTGHALSLARAGDKLLLNFMPKNIYLIFSMLLVTSFLIEIQLPFIQGELLEIESGQSLQNSMLHRDYTGAFSNNHINLGGFYLCCLSGVTCLQIVCKDIYFQRCTWSWYLPRIWRILNSLKLCSNMCVGILNIFNQIIIFS